MKQTKPIGETSAMKSVLDAAVQRSSKALFSLHHNDNIFRGSRFSMTLFDHKRPVKYYTFPLCPAKMAAWPGITATTRIVIAAGTWAPCLATGGLAVIKWLVFGRRGHGILRHPASDVARAIKLMEPEYTVVITTTPLLIYHPGPRDFARLQNYPIREPDYPLTPLRDITANQ
jgi:hypothetical protein